MPPDPAAPPEDQATQSEGWIAFKSISVAFALSRLLLSVQYLHTAYITRRHKRLLSLLIPAIASCVSALLWLVGGSLRSHQTVKLELCYAGLAVEYVVTGLLPIVASYIPAPSYAITERYGALTLVILGEGIISLVRSLSDVIIGFGFTNSGYLQSFCGLVVIFCVWQLLFHGFDTEVRMGRKRSLLWMLLHLPLHFVLLLVLTSIRNAATYSNIGDAIQTIGLNFNTMAVDLAAGNFSTDSIPLDVLSVQFAKLQLSPTLLTEIQQLQEEIRTFGPGHTDPNIEFWQYWGQVLVKLADFYEVQLSPDVQEIYSELAKINQTVVLATVAAEETQAQELLFAFMSTWITELLQGAFFFLPCMGGLVFLHGLLTLLRTPPRGKWMWTSWSFQMLYSVALCLLGLLDLGSQTLGSGMENDASHANAAYRLLDAHWTLPAAAIFYAVLVIVDAMFMLLARRAEGEKLNTDASFGVGHALSELSPLFGLGLSVLHSRDSVGKTTPIPTPTE